MSGVNIGEASLSEDGKKIVYSRWTERWKRIYLANLELNPSALENSSGNPIEKEELWRKFENIRAKKNRFDKKLRREEFERKVSRKENFEMVDQIVKSGEENELGLSQAENFQELLKMNDEPISFDGVTHFEGEKFFKNVQQLTFGGVNRKAFFS